MKKFILFLFALTLSIVANAQYELYLEGSLQQNSEGKLSLMIRNEEPLQMVQGDVVLPDGITLTAINSLCPIEGDFNLYQGVFKFMFLAFTDVKIDVNTTPKKIAEFVVNCGDVATGEYSIKIDDVKMAIYPIAEAAPGTTGPETTITVQKTAVIDEMPEGFGVTVSPFVAKDGDITLNFNYKSAKNIKNLSFDVQLPEGIFFMDDAEWDPANVNSQFTASCTSTPGFTVQLGDGDIPTSATIKVAGTYSAKTKKYINESENYSSLATITASVMTPENEYVDDWENAIMQEGLSTIKLSNIVLEDVEGNKYTGESLASVIYGKPAAQEAILYGNYDIPTIESFNIALKNVAAANITAINSENKGYFKDIITVDDNKKWCYYYRESEKYATTVMPYDLGVTLENQSYCTLYRVEDMTSESIVIKELSQGECIPANTPCIFKGTLSFLKENMPLNFGAIVEQLVGSTIFTGTYEATELANGEGYYISGGAFYNDGASISPFRAFFKGTVNGVKSFSVKVDTPNGLIDITNQLSDEAIYSLQGIRMSNAQKGINIKGGKKVYVK